MTQTATAETTTNENDAAMEKKAHKGELSIGDGGLNSSRSWNMDLWMNNPSIVTLKPLSFPFLNLPV